jgi:hypothetical protein
MWTSLVDKCWAYRSRAALTCAILTRQMAYMTGGSWDLQKKPGKVVEVNARPGELGKALGVLLGRTRVACPREGAGSIFCRVVCAILLVCNSIDVVS